VGILTFLLADCTVTAAWAAWRRCRLHESQVDEFLEYFREAAAGGAGGHVPSPWRKSSYSGNGGECVEACVAESGWVLVRDTTNRTGGTLSFRASAWRSFAERLKQR